MYENQKLTKKSESLSKWYNQIVTQADLIDYSSVRGCVVLKPYGYGIWELIQKAFNDKLKDLGIDNAYFPLFIPEELINKEAKHIEGFAPELARVSMGDSKDNLVIRPTSETIIYESFSKWIESWRDLPLKVNQWANIVRVEKRTYPFMRTTEFLWQEGHTAHSTHDEAKEMAHQAMDSYIELYKEYFGIVGIKGVKSESEKFAGAKQTLTYELIMPNGKALQGCTSHDLAQNFSKAFNVKFLNKENELEYAWTTSWGFSTRSIGGLILSHGDDKGLVLPPKLASIQVVVIPVDLSDVTVEYCKKVEKALKKDVRVKVDLVDNKTYGYKVNEWEMKGVPLRISIGAKEVANNSLSIARRDTSEKLTLNFTDKISTEIEKLFDLIHESLINSSQKNIKSHIYVAENYDKFKELVKLHNGFIKAFWCESADCESKIKEETKASTRCLPVDAKQENGNCIYCGKDAKYMWYFAKSY